MSISGLKLNDKVQLHPAVLWQCVVSVSPGVDLADGDVEACGDVFHRLVALRDDAHTFSNGLGCDWVVTSYHNNLKYRRTKIIERYKMKGE